MIDEGRRRDEQRLRRAQELADSVRDRQAELRLELLERSARARAAPADLAGYRKAATTPGRALPEDVC